MVAMVGSLVFIGALVAACAVLAAMIVPQWQRIAALIAGRPETAFAPLSQLAIAERRIAVRRWAARPVPTAISRLREAA